MRGAGLISLGLAVLLLVAGFFGCGPRTGDGGPKTGDGGGTVSGEGSITVTINNTDVSLKVKQMDIMLVDPEAESKYPESFVIWDKDRLELVGAFPLDIHVGYDEKMDRLIGRSIDIDKDGNPGGEGFTESYVTLPHKGMVKVSYGTLMVSRVLGPNPKGAGKIIEGTITLTLEDKTELKGTFVFLAVTYG